MITGHTDTRGGALFRPGSLTRLLHRLRTEGDSPARQAAAIGLGTYIGCTPFYGFHLLLSVVLASVFRLNRLKVYFAANISNPFVAPFLVAVELLVGGWITRGAWYYLPTLDSGHMWGLAQDLLVGSVVVGAVLGSVAAASTYALVARLSHGARSSRLIHKAASRYLASGCASWEMANGKLRGDPVYLEVLHSGVLPRAGTVIDCGCGRGLMLSLLAEARQSSDETQPAASRDPRHALHLIGIETRPRMVTIARQALGADASILAGDLRSITLPRGDVILLFDVIHLMPRREQDALLVRIKEALAPDGLLILREADAAGGWGFRAARLFNQLTRVLQGQWGRRFHFRAAAEWRQCLCNMGFEIEIAPMARGTPFANVVIYARRGHDGATAVSPA